MTQITIPAKVVNGHLQHEVSLAELEGQELIATLTVARDNDEDQINANNVPKGVSPDVNAEPEPPEWLEVEKDLYFPISPPEISLGVVKIKTEPGKPCIILPEELPDD